MLPFAFLLAIAWAQLYLMHICPLRHVAGRFRFGEFLDHEIRSGDLYWLW